MDFNYLYHRRGISVFMAANATCIASRRVHQEMAEAYARRIDAARDRRPAATA